MSHDDELHWALSDLCAQTDPDRFWSPVGLNLVFSEDGLGI